MSFGDQATTAGPFMIASAAAAGPLSRDDGAIDELRQFDEGVGIDCVVAPYLDRLTANAAQNGE